MAPKCERIVQDVDKAFVNMVKIYKLHGTVLHEVARAGHRKRGATDNVERRGGAKKRKQPKDFCGDGLLPTHVHKDTADCVPDFLADSRATHSQT